MSTHIVRRVLPVTIYVYTYSAQGLASDIIHILCSGSCQCFGIDIALLFLPALVYFFWHKGVVACISSM